VTRRVASVAVSVLLAAGVVVPAAADPYDQLERNRERQERIDKKQVFLQDKASSISGQLAYLDALRAQAERRVNALDSKLDRLDDEIIETRQNLANAQHHLALIEDELLEIQGHLVERTDIFTERAIAAYKAGDTAYLDGLLSSDSFAEVLERYRYHESALDTDSQLIELIQVLRDETDSRRALVEDKKNEIAEDKLALEKRRTTVAAIRAERADVLAVRREAVRAKRSLLTDVRRNQGRLERLEQKLRQDSAQIEALLAGGSSGTPVGGGQLLWPAQGPLTSGYGYRTHPIFGDQRLHTGIDIGAPYGSPVIAADAGVVVFAGVMSGYGNAVVVDHGGGLATTYNHLSSFAVSDGQTVGRGQYIAAVGCTGYCTGPHLHFEVRVNGNPVDPMPYLR
jgi:murein DD-endopeptidase MepM/ murein hydrolase activator NlpD